MARQPKLAYRYVGDGTWQPGIPARDLTAAEVKRMDQDTKEILKRSPLYDPVVEDKPAED